MKTQNEFRLIHGNFSPEEAREVLLSLIDRKIEYHNLRAFSNHIRFNDRIDNSQSRIAALQEMKASVSELFDSAARSGQRIAIDSQVTITLLDEK
ncbi:hypothetical protein HYN48_09605 [Flavobacterium magnum]|uniref:Uncharacterized protein n=1 Tax=Flavobacterium magnum TaxID=2162713 RepID=A0A2S0RG98_9FLAO|nr:hypothetical protein [Flavobacterium magnum]AWA30320.1 hypothetical protein HYN48_09605 [Flavobacterium magnum]